MKVVVVGGSIGGLSAAAALLKNGVDAKDVTVLERAAKIVPAGAGLGLDPVTCDMMHKLGFTKSFDDIGRPIPVEEHRVVDHTVPLHERTATSIIANKSHNHRSFHWSDIHRLLFDHLPEGMVKFAHRVVSYEQDSSGVTVVAERPAAVAGGDPQRVEFKCGLLVAADGSNSTVRKIMHPEDKRRYAGMTAWRGVTSGDSHPELLQELQADFRHLDRGITFDYSSQGGMNLIYMLPGNRINWLWYRDGPEPQLSTHSVTVKPTKQDIEKLYRDAEATWTPAFVELIKTTESPFLNAIFDKDPLQSWIDGKVVLLGEAAHPTTPHGSRSTNMSLQDAYVLGQCYARNPEGDFLLEYQQSREPQTSREVLFSRYVGELRQGRMVSTATFGWPERPETTRRLLLNALRELPDYKAHLKEELAGCA